MPSLGSMIELHINVSQFYRAREAIRMANDGKTYRGMFKDFIEKRMPLLVKYATRVTPKDTGWLSKSHIWTYDSHRMQGKIFINPRSVWLQGSSTIRWPKIYGPIVHERWRPFYKETMEYAEKVFPDGFTAAVRDIPWP